MDPYGFSTTGHRGFITDTGVASTTLDGADCAKRKLWVRLLAKEPKGDRAVGSALERRKAPEVRSTSVATICRMVVAY